ncbi:DNA polymerase epsilon subunit 2-like [Watersipora subatra]|uniref:DNA polymerase epsilon subunit 2-like n=1 Tax=Watersipora subatra TaxID=2589382 RepID=UPI00355B43F6
MASSLAKLRISILKSSKLYGFALNSESLKYLVEVLVDLAQAERDLAIEQIWSSLAKQKIDVGQITRQQCEQAVLEVTGHGKDGSVKLLDIIGAFEIPRYVYDKSRQKFTREEATLFPENCDEYSNHYRNRYNTLYQRILRSPLFSNKSSAGTDTTHKFKLKPLEALYGSNVLMENITVFGMITQLKPGAWYLEDFNAEVELDLSKAEFRPGLICDNTFVLCEGHYDNQILKVMGISLPPPETASLTRAYFGDTNFFGGELTTCAAANKALKAKEVENQDAFMVFLSNVHLDCPDVMNKLYTLFTGYSSMPPIAFVLCGPFLSPRVYPDPPSTLTGCLKNLGKIISSIAELKDRTMFVFVPAMEDVGSLSVYPRPPLCPSVTDAFTKQVKNAKFTTNPCRIQYCTKEIVVFREDLIPKMFRCRVNKPADDLPEHFTKTLVSTSSLSLLPLNTMPVFWSYDHAMSLYPLPSLVVAADSYYGYTKEYSGCTVVNPGSFPASKFSFKVYYPSSNEVEDSQISDNI